MITGRRLPLVDIKESSLHNDHGSSFATCRHTRVQSLQWSRVVVCHL